MTVNHNPWIRVKNRSQSEPKNAIHPSPSVHRSKAGLTPNSGHGLAPSKLTLCAKSDRRSICGH